VLLAAWLPASAATAQQVVVQNDSVVNFAQVAIQAGFVANEQAAAWLTSPCDGDLINVQILWLSLTGGAPDVLHESIRISQAGTFPTPGGLSVELLGPLLQDGGFNEFTLPTPLPVSMNETFVVALRFLDPPPATGPSVVTDIDGCQTGKNGIFAIPPNLWLDACLLGVSGDFAIRATIQCGTTPAVIFSDGFESGDTSAWTAAVP
jgi:hypothetical protein